jgi:glutamate/tyrosine decarboxylase-like PLP-dependent enzyme
MSINYQLQLSPDEMRQLGYRVIDEIVGHLTQLPDKPATHTASRAELAARWRAPLPEQGANLEEMFATLRRDVWPNMGHTQHPRFFAFIPSPNNFISVLAGALVAGFNSFAGNWLEASGPTQLELTTLDWLRQVCGLPETAGGHFVTGGSQANLTALAVARHAKLADRADQGVIYFSDQTHSSIERGLKVLGFAREQMRRLPSDEDFRLQLSALQQAVAADRAAGKQPFCVVANAGTTNTGAVDPLPELVEFCRAQNLWLHVDGAYGAAAALCERGRQALRGIEQVDSLALDPHKWLFQPYECGCVLVREGGLLKRTFNVAAEYLEDIKLVDEEVNFCEQGLQLTREFRALKLWLSLKFFGAAAFRQAIEYGIELAELTERVLREEGAWQVLSPACLGIVTFRLAPAGVGEAALNTLNQQLVSQISRDGFALTSSTTLKGKVALRMCTINPRTTEADIRATLARWAELGRGLLDT